MTGSSRFAAGTRRRASDYVGVAFFAGLAVLTGARSRELGILMLPSLWFEVLVAASFLIRREPRRSLGGWTPRVTAYGHSFLVPLFVLAAASWQPAWIAPTSIPELRVAGLLIWAIGLLLALWPVWYLRYSFSLEPAARDLVTTGPYRLLRHPIYTTYLLTYVGLLLMRPTLPLAAILLVWLAFLVARIRLEEAVLTTAFPEYRQYRERSWAVLPGF